MLVGFGAVTLASAAGDAVRTADTRLPGAAVVLLGLNALVLGTAGVLALDDSLGDGWVAALAVVHLAAGAAGGARVSGTLRLALLALGVALGDVALGLILDGAALTVAYTTSLVAVAWVASRGTPALSTGELLLGWALGAQALLAAGQALNAAPPDLALDGGEGAAAIVAPLAVALGCLVAGRLVARCREAWSAAVDALGLVALAYLAAVVLDGAWLVAGWAALATALLPPARPDRVAASGALGLLALAATHALDVAAPPAALVDGLDDPLAAILALGALAAATTALALARIADPSAGLRGGAGPDAEGTAAAPVAPGARRRTEPARAAPRARGPRDPVPGLHPAGHSLPARARRPGHLAAGPARPPARPGAPQRALGSRRRGDPRRGPGR